MKALFLALVSTALAGMTVAAAAAPPPDTKQVHARGCVQAASEGRCLVLKDVDSNVLYNLMIKGAGPDIGTGIEIIGAPFHGAPGCLQGVPVEVTSWTRKDYMKCTKMRGKSVQ